MALTGRQEEAAALVAADEISNEEIGKRAGVTGRQIQKWKHLPEFAARVAEHQAEYRATVRARGIAIMENRVDAMQERWLALKKVRKERAERYRDHELTEARSGYYVPVVKLVKVYDAGELVPTESHDELDGQPQGGALKRRRKDPLPDLSIKKLLETGKLPEGMDDVVFEVEDHKGGVLYSAKKSVEVIEWTLENALLTELRSLEKQAAQDLGQWTEKKQITGTQTIEITGIEVDA